MELKHWLRLFKGYFEDGRGHLCTLSTQYRAVMESVDPTISTFLQPFFDSQLPVMITQVNLDAPCIKDQIILYFEMAYPRHARRTALTNLRARDYPSDSKFMLAYQETAKDAAYNVTSPFVQKVLVNQAIATLEDEDRREKLRLRYKDSWTLEYIVALLTKWESSQASVDQQGRITHRARKQVSAQVNAVQPPRGRGRGSSTRNPAQCSQSQQQPRRPGPSSPPAAPAAAASPAPRSTSAAPARPSRCYQCGGAHPQLQCPYITHTCDKCGTVGHPGFNCKKSARAQGVAAAVQESVLPSSFADTLQGTPTPRTQV